MPLRKPMGALLLSVLISSPNLALAEENPRHARQASSITAYPPITKGEQPAAPFVEKYLLDGTLKNGEIATQTKLKEHPQDDQLRFGLAMLQVVRAIESLVQDVYRLGVRSEYTTELVLPLPKNPSPQKATYQHLRTSVANFNSKLTEAENTLAGVTDEMVKLPLHFGLIKLDFNGDGRADQAETLWKLYAQVTRNTKISKSESEYFYICFDRGDTHWLRGYCHLVMAACEIYLAHDSKEAFDRTAHAFFAKVDTPYAFMSTRKPGTKVSDYELGDIMDLTALVHLIKWEVVEPQRMEAALYHLEEVVAQNRHTWKAILSETDDDREFLPNPSQTGVIPNMEVTDAMVTAWNDIMDEIGNILAGKVLVTSWRGNDSRGINVRRVFLEQREFDLVLWIQGSAMKPYLEKGPRTSAKDWRNKMEPFGSHFPGFALWFN